MTYRLLASDIDGTLLDSNSVITEITKLTIRKAVENGLIFTLSTGRPVQGVKDIINELDIDMPIISYNGAMVILGRSKEILYSCQMKSEDARAMYKLGLKFGTTVMVWSQNRLFVSELNEKAITYSKLGQTKPEVISDIEEIIKNGVTKILWYDEVELIEKYKNQLCNISACDNVVYHTSQPYFLEFVDTNATKAIAMEKLGQHYGISCSEMIAVGDGYNDLSMIEYAGLGVAMGNACDFIKEKSDFVTLTNDENGLAYVIDKFVLKTF